MHSKTSRTPRLLFALAFAGLSLGACKDKTTEPIEDDEPEVVSVVITSGANTVTVPVNGTQTPGALSLKVNTANPITVRWLNAAGQDDPHVTTAEFELRITTPAGMTFTSGAGFTGTITPTATGASAFTVNLYHKEEQHNDVSKSVSVNVVP